MIETCVFYDYNNRNAELIKLLFQSDATQGEGALATVSPVLQQTGCVRISMPLLFAGRS